MSINSFFITLSIVLASIFLFFKPLDIKTIPEDEPIAQLQISDFTVYRVFLDGVKSIISADIAELIDDTYKIDNITVLDRSREHVEQMRADRAEYSDGVVTLEQQVVYLRDDELKFESSRASWSEKSSVIRVDGAFVLSRGEDKMRGTDLLYDTELGKYSAKKVNGTYEIKEKI